MKKLIVFFVILIFSLNLSYTKETELIKTAVINFTPVGTDKSTADAITENLINLLIDSKGFDIVDKNKIKTITSVLNIIDSEGFNDELRTQLLSAFQVKLIILGNVTKIGDVITVNIKGINAENGAIKFAKRITTNNINDIALLIPVMVDMIYEIESQVIKSDIVISEVKEEEKIKTPVKEKEEVKQEKEITTDNTDKNKVIIIINDDKNTIITTDNDKTTIKTEDKKDEVKIEDVKKETVTIEDKNKEIKEAEKELEKQEKEIKEKLQNEKEESDKEKKNENIKSEFPTADMIFIKEIKVDDSWHSRTLEIGHDLRKIKFKKIIISVENNCVEFSKAKLYFDDPYDDIKFSENFFLGKNDIWSKTIDTLTKKGNGRKLNKINLVVKNRKCYNESKAIVKIYGIK